MGGNIGWRTPFYTDNVKAIVAYEPGGTPFVFPENEMPKPVRTTFAPLAATAMSVPLEEFRKLTRIPIIIYYGDYIADEPSSRSEEHTSELQSLMRISYAVFCLKKK